MDDHTTDDNILRALLRGEIFLPHHRRRLRELTTIEGISEAEQRRIWQAVLDPNTDLDKLRTEVEQIEARVKAKA